MESALETAPNTAQANRLLRAYAGPTLSACGADAIAEVAARLHTACLTLASLPGDGPRATFGTWPAYRHDWWDEGNEASKKGEADMVRRFLQHPRFAPTAREIDLCIPTLALLDGVSKAERIVLRARAVQEWYGHDGGWRGVGKAAGVSHATARRLHWGACLLATARDFERQLSARAGVPKLSR